MNFPSFFLLLLPHQAFQHNHGKERIWSNCEEFFLTNNMIAGAERITIGLGRSNLSVVCTVDNTTSEVIMLLQHSTMDFIKVDGFQEPGSFHQVVDYELSLAEMVGLLGVSSRCWQILEFRQYFSTLVTFLTMMRNLLAESRCHQAGLSSYSWWLGGLDSVSRGWSCPGRCSCDSRTAGVWLADRLTITDPALLPVISVALGDTGHPRDDKMGRIRISPLM